MQPPDPPNDDSYEKQEELLKWVRANFLPLDIFTDFELSQWALENGFKKIIDAE